MEQIKQLSKPLDTEIIVYGRLPVMLTERRLIKTSAPLRFSPRPLAHERRLRRRTRAARGRVPQCGLRPDVVFLADRLDEVLLAGVRGMRLMFTNEGARECVEVAKSFLGRSEYRPNGLTRGLYYRGVE